MQPKIIMMIDDDEDDRVFFRRALTQVSADIAFVSARDGVHAFEILESTTLPDLIFLDLNMPRLNGKQCLLKLKASDRLKHIPVVIYSTTKRTEDEIEMKNLGALYFLTKATSITDISKQILFVLSLQN